MNRNLLFLISILLSTCFYSQVGINTVYPTASLDVNGNVRIRTALSLPDSQDIKVMVLDSANVVNITDVNKIFNDSPTASTIVKGNGGSGFSVLSLSLLNGWQKVSFPTIEIDEGLDFDITAQEFTAEKSGIYNVYFTIEFASLLSATTMGAGIFKIQSGMTAPILLCEESFLSVNLLSINVSPPIRKTQTIVKLEAGDKIIFGVRVPLLNINTLSNSQATFTIWRMK